ncbi:unnamed protein product [Dovyalis caffra]|uniref:Uncharacterized protein n=1 Tax=Dovyalis caffra TaxID=77055 RepID=A0AAV1RWI3_9ROSI|nr:unnamed protein product [Dovyalis caffra]
MKRETYHFGPTSNLGLNPRCLALGFNSITWLSRIGLGPNLGAQTLSSPSPGPSSLTSPRYNPVHSRPH